MIAWLVTVLWWTCLGIVLPISIMMWLILRPFKFVFKAIGEGLGESISRNKSIIEKFVEQRLKKREER
jgi:hypothetical protein